MLLNPKLAAIPLIASTLLLTSCTVNAPVTTDVHDNLIEVPDLTINTPEWKMPDGSSTTKIPPNPLSTEDPNATQDTPDSWDKDDVATPEPVPLPTAQG